MSWTHFKKKTVTIRKERICWGCLRSYPVGSQMVYNVGAWENDGLVATYDCPTCEELKIYLEAPFEQGHVSEEINNCDGFNDIKTPEDLLNYFKQPKPGTGPV